MIAFALALLLPYSAVAPATTPTPIPTARPAPVLGRSGEPARPKSLAEHAQEMKEKKTPAKKVSFDDVRTVDAEEAAEAAEATATAPAGRSGARAGSTKAGKAADTDAATMKAQRRMDRAVQRGLAVPDRTRGSSRDRARHEWDEAAEACRTTPGCTPRYRDDASFGENKPLKTDRELIDDIRKRGFGEPHPLPK